MPGPPPSSPPNFPVDFLELARQTVRQRTITFQLRQRATLVLLLYDEPLLSNVEAAKHVHLHPDSVRHGRRRWAHGHYSLADEAGRGRKPRFSPSRPGAGQGGRL